MELSEPFKHSGAAVFSPNGQYIATTVLHRVIVRDALSLNILQLFSCQDFVSDLAWAPDSNVLAVMVPKLSAVVCFSMSIPDWTAKISEGIAGVKSMEWSPDSRHLLIFTDFRVIHEMLKFIEIS
jgi:WD40 repeat protein